MTKFKKSLKLELEKQDEHMRVREWFSKWDRTIAAITALVVFCALLILVIVSIKARGDGEDDSETGNATKKTLIFYGKDSLSCGCKTEGTVLTCTDTAVENVCSVVNDCSTHYEMTFEQLILTNIKPQNNQIEEGWLDCVNFKITRLTISGSELTNIGAKAFSGPQLTLNSLNLNNIGVSAFRKDMFEGLAVINLAISCDSSDADFEANVFEAVSRKLQILQISNCISQSEGNDRLTNITGSSQNLTALVQLDIRSNNLNYIKATNFQSAKSLTTLYLGNSKVVTIEPNSFKGFSLGMLDLSYNDGLKTLPNGLFHSGTKGITIAGNTFKCDCYLEWLQELFDNRHDLFQEKVFYCEGKYGESLPYKEKIPFCPNGTTTTTPPPPTTTSKPDTTTTTTNTPEDSDTTDGSTTTAAPPALMKIKCSDRTGVNITPQDQLCGEVSIRDKSVKMEFFVRNKDSTPTYLLQITGKVSKSSFENILWYNTNNNDIIMCANNLTDGIEITLGGLDENATYIFCVIDPSNGNGTVSPLDCGAFTIPFRIDETLAWISQNDMIAVICGFCGSLILVSLITGFIVFYCIRQHPSLIKGNKRVIIVESKAADAIVMPRYYDEINYNPPSLNSYSNGYLTPKHRGVYSPPRPSSRLRTISENTDFSVPTTSSGGRMKKGHYKKRTRLEHVTRAFDEHVYEPPPLPPNHPSGFHYNDSFNRNYSRV
ncbi:uncharacterized protein LOC135141202 isoform X2 [Zophobas morio]|uniref:uncharacterized protein LOC135141202 isoform X2 n=1 Tax=Zophobas morio TaxID=2755281 RepID=UPI003083A184